MTFEEWWEKNVLGIHKAVQSKNFYIKPFFQDNWNKAVESKEGTAFQELKDLIDPEGEL